MRLVLLRAPGLSERLRMRSVLAAERVLAERGVTLSDCLDAIATEARKEKPNPANWLAFHDAERAALTVAWGATGDANDAMLGLALGSTEISP